MADFWKALTGKTYGASFDTVPLTRAEERKEELAKARERERERDTAASGSSGALAAGAEKVDGRADRFHENDAQKRERVMSDVYVNACLQGEHVTSAAYWQKKPERIEKHTASNCSHLLPSGMPCYHNLWAGGKRELEDHLSSFVGMSRKPRTQRIYDELSPFSYHSPPLPDGKPDPKGVKKWHFFMNDRLVCKPVYVMCNPVGLSTLEEKLKRYKDARPTAHNSSEEGWQALGTGPAHRASDWKAISVIAWYQYMASKCGDYMPEGGTTVLPIREKKDEWREFCAGRTADQHVAYGYWCDIWKHSPELAHICHARKTLNFQHCTLCVEGNADVAASLKSGDASRIAASKRKRGSHHDEARSERVGYHNRREDGRDPTSDSVSIILDKWDSSKCTVPYFSRKPGGWWNVTSKDVLNQHVLGVMVHATPQNKVYMYTFNDSVGGGANSNIEGLRRTLAREFAGKPMPRIVYVQADNASDNKCWTVLLFLAMLVYHGYTAEVYFSFLLVGHTHEDIDALFSVISRFFRQIPGHAIEGKTPQSFQTEMAAALAERFEAHCDLLESVLDWDSYLKPHKHPGTTGIQHIDIAAEPEAGARAPHRFWIHRRERDGAVGMLTLTHS